MKVPGTFWAGLFHVRGPGSAALRSSCAATCAMQVLGCCEVAVAVLARGGRRDLQGELAASDCGGGSGGFTVMSSFPQFALVVAPSGQWDLALSQASCSPPKTGFRGCDGWIGNFRSVLVNSIGKVNSYKNQAMVNGSSLPDWSSEQASHHSPWRREEECRHCRINQPTRATSIGDEDFAR